MEDDTGDYDKFLEKIGGCGRYQLLLFCLLATTTIKAGIDVQALVLACYTPDFQCISPWNTSEYNNTIFNCKAPTGSNASCSLWSFDKSVMSRTLVTDYNLVCSASYIVPLIQTVSFIGSGIGQVIGGLSDIIGRRMLILILISYDVILTLLVAFVPSLEAQFILRFLQALANAAFVQGMFLIMELVSTKYRLNVGSNYWLFWCGGYAGSALLGKYLANWSYIQAASLIVLPSYIALFFFLCESPRWLLVKGRKKDAIKVLRKIARWNGKKDIPDEMFLRVRAEEETSTGKLQDAFSSRLMALKTISACVIMWTFSFTYFGLVLDAKFASDDIFLNIAALGLVEIPASPLGWIIGDKIGRRLPTFFMLVATSVCVLSVPHMPKNEYMWIRTAVAIMGKLILATGYIIGGVYMTELQPTSIRNVSAFPSRLLNTIGTIVAPFVLHLSATAEWIPSVVLGSQCILGALILIPLPETRGLPLPQTVPEANLLSRGEEKNYESRLAEMHRKDNEFELGVREALNSSEEEKKPINDQVMI